MGVQSEDIADRHERERPAIVALADPFLGVSEELAPIVVARAPVLVEARGRIEQHRPQHTSFTESSTEAAAWIELRGKQHFGERLERLRGANGIGIELHG